MTLRFYIVITTVLLFMTGCGSDYQSNQTVSEDTSIQTATETEEVSFAMYGANEQSTHPSCSGSCPTGSAFINPQPLPNSPDGACTCNAQLLCEQTHGDSFCGEYNPNASSFAASQAGGFGGGQEDYNPTILGD